MSAAPGGCPLLARPAPLIGALGTSITFGAELDPVVNLTRAPSKHAWPSKLQSLLRERGFANAKVLNGAARGSGADYASLCFDHVWAESTGKTVAPPLDLAIIEYTWTSNVPMMEALIQMLHSRKIPVLAILYYHAANPARFGHVKNNTTPWANYERAVGGYRAFSNLFRRLGVPAVNNSDVNSRYRYCEPQIMSEEGRCQLPLATRSKRHPSKLAHDFLARLVLDEMLSSCTALSGPLPLCVHLQGLHMHMHMHMHSRALCRCVCTSTWICTCRCVCTSKATRGLHMHMHMHMHAHPCIRIHASIRLHACTSIHMHAYTGVYT